MFLIICIVDLLTRSCLVLIILQLKNIILNTKANKQLILRVFKPLCYASCSVLVLAFTQLMLILAQGLWALAEAASTLTRSQNFASWQGHLNATS